ncbi:hypothetical protein M3Y98_01147700 [Aphelenchoides besseyi]|nr:hypothetical protein M3Y98_01147700 [Aphelenchoides besseyi]KAI6210753.1 hypothetical protein M3Y96_00361400 [Aphelenchoides besseyi]
MNENIKLISEYYKVVDEKEELKKKVKHLLKLYKKKNEHLKMRLNANCKKIEHIKAERNNALKKLERYRAHCLNLQQRVTNVQEEKNSSKLTLNKLQFEIQLKNNVIRQQIETLNQFFEERLLQERGLDYAIKPQKPDMNRRF